MTESSNSLWVRRYHPSAQAGSRLVCFPHAGGSASFYGPFSRALAPTADALLIQYPGRQDRLSEPMIDSIDELADRIATELLPWLDRPATLFGHSMGAAVAFEVTKRLAGNAASLSGLVVSAARAPALPRGERFHLLDKRGLTAHLAAMNGTDAAALANEELLDMALPAVRNDYRAIELYQCGPTDTVPVPILALVGDHDERETPENMRGWAEHTTVGYELRVLPGGHFYLTDQVDTVAKLILTWMADR